MGTDRRKCRRIISLPARHRKNKVASVPALECSRPRLSRKVWVRTVEPRRHTLDISVKRGSNPYSCISD